MLVAVVSALAAALLYAVASVMQQRAAARAPLDEALKLSLLGRLARSRLWLVGIAADVAGYVMQFLALQHGSLVLVQPLLVCGLLFALPLGAGLRGARLNGIDWAAAVAVCAGLLLFLVQAGGAQTQGRPDAVAWALMLAVSAAVMGVLILGARGRPRNQRAALMSAAAGVIYGVSAAFTKTTGHNLTLGVGHVLVSWEAWMLVVTGVIGLVIAQSAFQAGTLAAALPPMTVIDPVVSVVIGAVAFDETLPATVGATALEVIGLVVMAAGVFVLARAKAVQAVHGPAG
jgi:drug/metabolite transporter (DMT)-like permease